MRTLNHSTQPDRRRCNDMLLDSADGVGVVDGAVGSNYESDRDGREQTLEVNARVDGEGTLEDGARVVLGDGEWKRCAEYETRNDVSESCWAPWTVSGSEKRSRLPERKDFSIWRSGDDPDCDDQMKDFSDSLLINDPIAAIPTSVVVPEEPAFRVGAGLLNLGNTCFMNSVLQCLVRTPPLMNSLIMMEHFSPCNSFIDEFCLICALREHMELTFGSHDAIAPHRIVANLTYFSTDFVPNQQEDAHEFLQCFLDKLEKYPFRSWNLFSSVPSENLVNQVFSGSLISSLRCSECRHVSVTPEDLIDFSLEIDDVNTLEGALDSFTKLEKIEDIKLTCDGCNEKVSMEKQFMINKAPLVASFHLKRFKNDGITVKKIDKHVEYPVTLNLHSYTMGHPEHSAELLYILYAVVVHSGSSSTSGHYCCYVRSSLSTWHEFDDTQVTRVSESHVLSQEAYILFYAKRGTPWFSNANEVQSLCPPNTSRYSPNSVLEKSNQYCESDSSTENLCKRDAWVNQPQEFSEATCQPLRFEPQHVSFEAGVENKGFGKYSNSEDDNRNEVDMEDLSFNFEVPLNVEDGKNRNRAAVTNNSSLNFDTLEGESNNDQKQVTEKNGPCFSSEEKIEATRVQICTISTSNNEKCGRSSSLCEASGDPKKSSTFNCLGQVTYMGMINKMSPGEDSIKAMNLQTRPSGSAEVTKVSKPVLQKRPAEKSVDDPRKKQIIRTLKRMPSKRARMLLSFVNGSPPKKNMKNPTSAVKKRSPRSACLKNNTRVVPSPSFRRSAIFQ